MPFRKLGKPAFSAGLARRLGLGSGALDSAQYWKKVKALAPIAYWPLWDAVGSGVAIDLMGLGNGADGPTTKAPTHGAVGIGDSKTSFSFDGGDYLNIYSAALAAAFNGSVGTVAAWVQCNDWTSAAFRRVFALVVDGDNSVSVQRQGGTNNALLYRYEAGNVIDSVIYTSSGPTGFFHVAITWDKSAEQLKAYFNGVQVGTTQINLGVWVGSLAATTTHIGAPDTTPNNAWNGKIAHVGIWTRALTVAEVAMLANP